MSPALLAPSPSPLPLLSAASSWLAPPRSLNKRAPRGREDTSLPQGTPLREHRSEIKSHVPLQRKRRSAAGAKALAAAAEFGARRRAIATFSFLFITGGFSFCCFSSVVVTADVTAGEEQQKLFMTPVMERKEKEAIAGALVSFICYFLCSAGIFIFCCRS